MAKDQCTTQAHSNVVLTDPTNTIDGNSEFWRWESFNVVEGRPQSSMSYSTGTPARRNPQDYQDLIVVAGSARVYPSWNFLTTWWPRILHGGAMTNEVLYGPGSTLAEWFAAKFDGVETRLLSNLVVASATLSASEGGPVMLDLNVIGKTATDDTLPGTLPAQGEADLDNRILFSGSTFTHDDGGGDELYAIDRFAITIDHLVTPKYWNSTTAQCLQSNGRIVSVGFGMPWNDDTQTDFHRQGDAGLDVLLTLQSGVTNAYEEIYLNQIKYSDTDPPVLFEGDMPFDITGVCHESGSEAGMDLVDDIGIIHYAA